MLLHSTWQPYIYQYLLLLTYMRQTDNHTQDNILPTDTWQLAIDSSTLMVQDSTEAFLTENEGKLPFQVWETESQPITMTVKVCEVEWELNKNTAASPPQSPVACVENGTVDQVRLVPFVAARLRLGESFTSLMWYMYMKEGNEKLRYFIKLLIHFWHSWYWTCWQTAEDRLLVTF